MWHYVPSWLPCHCKFVHCLCGNICWVSNKQRAPSAGFFGHRFWIPMQQIHRAIRRNEVVLIWFRPFLENPWHLCFKFRIQWSRQIHKRAVFFASEKVGTKFAVSFLMLSETRWHLRLIHVFSNITGQTHSFSKYSLHNGLFCSDGLLTGFFEMSSSMREQMVTVLS